MSEDLKLVGIVLAAIAKPLYDFVLLIIRPSRDEDAIKKALMRIDTTATQAIVRAKYGDPSTP